jgi:hypothetical protein
MAGRKRRKPGVTGFIADAISDRQKAQAQNRRLEAKAQLAWAKENARMATANAREKARQEQREAREQEIAEGRAEAEAVTRTLQAHLTELSTLLTGTLNEDPYLPWDRFRVPLLAADFKRDSAHVRSRRQNRPHGKSQRRSRPWQRDSDRGSYCRSGCPLQTLTLTKCISRLIRPADTRHLSTFPACGHRTTLRPRFSVQIRPPQAE